MSDNERPRDRNRERDSRREQREGRDQGGAPSERRNRSRSPRRDRGGGGGGGAGARRDNRYRSRSPFKREERGGRGRGGERDSDERTRSGPVPPKGPRNGPGPRRADFPPKPVRVASPPVETPDIEMTEDKQKPEDMDDDEWAMMQTMGFSGFKSTKNTKVPGNDKNFGIRRDKTMEARQYMNRQGGFNRPLSPGRG
ncbi:hypothetical protein P153DRAFT_367371 [Dothidotthia symphoricarpi CBS 119687]|uniref:U4/U6.U5 small nuclear ribonucleoprotein 27kDa protein domain-containing protein n=1 Tax=Dothidotthia symphoricarpi CBS 119687 TaxID=1392245 RepID=A0A6A6ADY0_9PLEO|nr:uncharacterized protein P153DRAFT_367371 [Dothidotthia symphoricarpi CBS 119687]KAF2129097.1 hypothetical protein P153DRAFT_367371 [Dothidotthia symphoricarpi CBS 119687]